MNLQSASTAQQIRIAPGQQRDCVDVTDQRAVDHLTRQWGVTEFDLRRAVAEAGEVADDVRSHLGLG